MTGATPRLLPLSGRQILLAMLPAHGLCTTSLGKPQMGRCKPATVAPDCLVQRHSCATNKCMGYASDVVRLEKIAAQYGS